MRRVAALALLLASLPLATATQELRLIKKPPPHPKVLSQFGDLESGHVPEVAGSEIYPVPVNREAAQLELDQAADEGGTAESHWSPQRIASYDAGAPVFHREPEL